MRRLLYGCVIAAVVVAACSSQKGNEAGEDSADLPSRSKGMRAPADFEAIDGKKARSKALFKEMGRALEHPRCMNCHPAGNNPLVGDESKPHQPKLTRGENNMGPPGMRCTTCHGRKTYENMPGAAGWHMAPREMAWEGKSVAEICKQLKDPERNGGRSPEEVAEHIATDHLVAYGWDPPEQYEAVPGSQKLLGNLAHAWVETGAHCPEPSDSK